MLGANRNHGPLKKMIATEERPRTAAPMGKIIGVERRGKSRHKFLEDLTLGFALMWDRRVPIGVKIEMLALAVGIVACVLALEIPIEGLIVAALSKSGFRVVLALDCVEAIVGPIILSCFLLPSLAPKSDQLQGQGR
jgi:hypothetical protein